MRSMRPVPTARVAIQGVRSLGYEGGWGRNQEHREIAAAVELLTGHDSLLDHTFQSPAEARFRVKHAGTNQPAAGATVRAKSERTMLRGSGVGVTDVDGGPAITAR